MPSRPGAAALRPLTRADLPHVHRPTAETRAHTRAAVASGAWLRIAPGAYVSAADVGVPTGDGDAVISPDLLHRARLVALGGRLRAPYAFSHTSAALLWGLPTLRPATEVHLMQGHRARAGSGKGVVRHYGPDSVRAARYVAGLRVTCLTTTVADCLALLPGTAGLVVADGALRGGLRRQDMMAALAERTGTRGVVRARAVAALADDGAESPPESVLRAVVLRLGYPPPSAQVPVDTADGRFWGDLGWTDEKVLLEYDGRGKYETTGGRELLRERRRDDLLREAGWTVLRFTADDLARPAVVGRRIAGAAPQLRRGRPRPWLA